MKRTNIIISYDLKLGYTEPNNSELLSDEEEITVFTETEQTRKLPLMCVGSTVLDHIIADYVWNYYKSKYLT